MDNAPSLDSTFALPCRRRSLVTPSTHLTVRTAGLHAAIAPLLSGWK